MTKEKDNKTNQLSYYGKKIYCLNPVIARKKLPETKKPNYLDEETKRHPEKRND